jgi:3-deoxy-D-manno-octulosonate 8-phosphate phosphatase (KDO 8-P phosphatase)
MAMPLDINKAIKEYAEKNRAQLSKIKVCLFDIDGVLTDGSVFWSGDDIGYTRITNIRDGWAMKFLQRKGFKIGIISGGREPNLVKRFSETLKLDYVFLGNEDKRDSYKKILADGFKDEEILYVGDEFIDIPILKRVGFSATVPNASYEIQEIVHYITFTKAGHGAAREVMDLVRIAQNLQIDVPEF